MEKIDAGGLISSELYLLGEIRINVCRPFPNYPQVLEYLYLPVLPV